MQWKHWLAETTREIVTTELVFWEVLNSLSGSAYRVRAVRAYRECEDDPGIEIVPVHSKAMRDAVALYESRPDKSWSHTDCHSFLVMRSHDLTEALTPDHHFQQAGFRALLFEGPPAEA
jgi:predicted nucleic acid-binding protein